MKTSRIVLSLENITFSYKDTPVINDFSLDVEEGSFTTLLGSSGCGKTTLLRLISGFLEPQEGLIKINGQIQNGVLPNKRKIGMVFQDYALFPHLTVEQNLLYGLKINSKSKKEENLQLVHETAKNLSLEELLKRYPAELSGGQQQRVALGRVLVLQPKILLMDEPLSSLDTNLRIKVREELKNIQKELKITTIYVTHDQEEALSLSDNIAVLNNGNLIEQGSPQELYYKPQNKFTAAFIGQANFVSWNNTYLIRPEWINVSKASPSDSENSNKAKVLSSSFLGDITRLELLYNGQKLIADTKSLPGNDFNPEDSVYLDFLHKWQIKD